MPRPTLKEDTKMFLGQLRGVNGAIGNIALRGNLGWSDTRYWKVHTALVEEGRIVKGRGRGGSVARAGR